MLDPIFWITLWAAVAPRLSVLLLITIIDFVLGVLVALVGKTFKWSYLAHYLQSDVLPIFGWLVVAILAAIPAALVPSGVAPFFEYAVYATVFIDIMASVLESLKSIGVLRSGNLTKG